MQIRSSLQRRNHSESSDRLVANIKPRSWGDPHQQQAAQPQPTRHDFSHVDLFAHDPGPRTIDFGIQPKLTVGAPNDVYEQEADRVAAQVMTMPDAKASVQREAVPEEERQTKPLGDSIQRDAMPEEDEALQAKPLAATITPLVQRDAMPEEDEALQTKPLGNAILQREAMPEQEEIQTKRSPTPHSPLPTPSLESRLSSSQGGGSPLPDEVRSFMEPRFGADFSQVRVHTGSNSVQMNRDLSAQAFTHKQDVYFGDGKAPAKDALTAHELTHVVQQTGTIAQTKADPEKVSKKVAPSLLPGLSGRNTAIQRAPGLPNKAELRGLGFKPGTKPLRTSEWEKLEKALDEYRAIGNADYSGQEQKIAEIELVISGWWTSHVSPQGAAKKSKEQAKVDEIKSLRGKIKIRKTQIDQLKQPPIPSPPTPSVIPTPIPQPQPPTPSVIPTLNLPVPNQPQPQPPTPSVIPTPIPQPPQPQPQSEDTQTATNTQVITPPQPQPPPVQVLDPWKTATLKADPAFRPEHQGANWHVKSEVKFALFNNGVIGESTTFIQGNVSSQVQNVAAHTRTKQLLKAGAKLSGGTYVSYPEQKVVSQVVRAVPGGDVIQFAGNNTQYLVPTGQLQTLQYLAAGTARSSPDGTTAYSPFERAAAVEQILNTVEGGYIVSIKGDSNQYLIAADQLKTKQTLSAGTTYSSLDRSQTFTSERLSAVEKIRTIEDQRAVRLSNISTEFLVAVSDLSNVQEDGYKFTYGGVDYWALQTHLHQLSAGHEDAAESPLYPTDPSPSHVLQGALGDCYLMAAAASIAHTKPAYIKEMIRDNEDGTVSVRLHNVTQSSNSYVMNTGEYAPQGFAATPMYIKVNKSVAKKAGKELYAQDNLWVIMLEKAYAASGLTGQLLQSASSGSYQNLASGNAGHAFEVLLGQEATKPNVAVKQQAQGDAAIFNQMQQALTAGKAVAAGTRQLRSDEAQSGTGHSGNEAISGGMVADHAYSVLSVRDDGQQKIIKVRNPWGKRDNTPNDPDKGVFELTLTQFLNWFTSLSISGEIRTLSQ